MKEKKQANQVFKLIRQQEPQLWIAGGGIAGMAVAAFAIRDAGVSGNRIHILEETKIAGGSLDGAQVPGSIDNLDQKKAVFTEKKQTGGHSAAHAWVTRGGRMLTDETYLCLWDLFSSIPSLENPDVTVRDEVVNFNNKVRTDAHARLIDHDHKIIDAHKLGFRSAHRMQMLKLLSLSENVLGTKRIDEIFSEDFFETNFWRMWRTTFAFQKWHSAVELKRYFLRFIQEFPRIDTLAGVRRTKYNQYDSLVAPLQKWLVEKGVQIHFDTKVLDANFHDIEGDHRYCESLGLQIEGKKIEMSVGKNDLVFLTLGSITSDASFGGNHSVPELIRDRRDGGWSLWENISSKANDFGRPMSFYGNVDEHKWESFTLTMTDDTLIRRIESYSGNAPGTGALMTFFESGWHLSIVVPYQPHFADLPEGVCTLWGYGFQVDQQGDYIKKKMSESTGEEVLRELLGHLGFQDIEEHVVKTTEVTTVMMPYASALFACRSVKDRPLVVPKGSQNFAFLGQFVEIPGDVVFTVEYSVRAAMIAVYEFFKVDRKIPEIYNGILDPKVSLAATKCLFR